LSHSHIPRMRNVQAAGEETLLRTTWSSVSSNGRAYVIKWTACKERKKQIQALTDCQILTRIIIIAEGLLCYSVTYLVLNHLFIRYSKKKTWENEDRSHLRRSPSQKIRIIHVWILRWPNMNFPRTIMVSMPSVIYLALSIKTCIPIPMQYILYRCTKRNSPL